MLVSLDQSITYAGMLEGVPSSLSNDAKIETILADALASNPKRWKPHLIAPARRDYRRVPGDMNGIRSSLPIEWIPLVTCVGLLRSEGPLDPLEEHRGPPLSSERAIVWFQDEFAPPILEPALSAILRLDWASVANEFTW